MTVKREHTSNVDKLARHTDALHAFRLGRARPILLVLAPTAACNLDCPACCYSKRDAGQLDLNVFIHAMESLKRLGLKSVEFAGGGEPTLHPRINDMIEACYRLGLPVGIDTNGTRLDLVEPALLNGMRWIRLAGGTIEAGKRWQAERLPSKPDLGACYVWHDGSTVEGLRLIAEACERIGAHLRLVPDAIGKAWVVEQRRERADAALRHIGSPRYAYLADLQLRPPNGGCYNGYLKPFLWYDAWLYACPSSCLSDENARARGLDPATRLCPVPDIEAWYTAPPQPHDFGPCRHCHYADQSEYLHGLTVRGPHDDFV